MLERLIFTRGKTDPSGIMCLWGVAAGSGNHSYKVFIGRFDSSTPYSEADVWLREPVYWSHSGIKKLTPFWPHLLAARKADFQSVNRGSIPRGVIMTEKRQLTNGYYAIKYKGDREWSLYQENSYQLIKSARTLQELRDFLKIRELWRG